MCTAPHTNLISKTNKQNQQKTKYEWYASGMLKRVTKPDGKEVVFKYDALGRRIEKTYDGTVTRWLWDGNVPLHEWSYREEERPKQQVGEWGDITYDKKEPTTNLITWLFDEDTFHPSAKITEGKTESIICDYLGTPQMMFDSDGNKTWESTYDIYGRCITLTGKKLDCPFRYQGQYEDEESGLYYNRFRYYSPDEGSYISQDPIGLEGDNPNIYAYVQDSNAYSDPFGLDELYALLAKKDGWYPVMEYGKKQPIGEMFLKQGELWKIGTSKDAGGRYTAKYLKNIGVELKVLSRDISRNTSLFLENLKLKGYLAWKGFLPAGNKCKH